MQIEQVAIGSLTEDPANVRSHNDRNLEAIRASLARFGQQKPIVVDCKGVVVAGNCTLRAARALGWEKIDVVRTGLDGVNATAYAIADNRIAELAEWEYQPLAEVMRSLREVSMDLNDLGWADHEVEPLLQAEWKPPAIDDGGGSGDGKGGSLAFTADGWEAIQVVVAKVRKREDDPTITPAQAVLTVCKEWGQTE